MNQQEVVMLVGCPASGKGSLVKERFGDYVVLNRDSFGGKVESLVPRMIAAISNGDSVVLDNTFPTAESRKEFLHHANLRHVPVRCLVMGTTIEEAQVNALNRMWDRYEQVFYTAEDIKSHPRASRDPNMFPVAALFHYRKQYEPPEKDEGFCDHPETVPFVRKPWKGTKKAIVLDYDDTLRKSKGPKGYPLRPSEIEILPGRTEVLKKWRRQGYILLGASNQSGVAKKEMTFDEAKTLFECTNKLLGVEIDFQFCPHSPAPITCYCRKPQSGVLVHFIRKHGLYPPECIFVGDKGTDASAARRVGFQFKTAEEFFA